MIRSLVLSAILLFTLSTPATAVIRHVPADFPTIQQALDASSSGDEVVVAAGTYVENLEFDSPHDGVVLRSESGPQVTFIDGGSDSTSVVRMQNVGALTSIEGFTIRNGHAFLGGGLRLFNASPRVHGNFVRENSAMAGGGLYAEFSSPTVTENWFLDNDAPTGSGGGAYFDVVSAGLFERNIVARNTCGAFGGGLTIWDRSSTLVRGNTIVLNRAALSGGGVYVRRDANVVLTRNIVASNPEGGGVEVTEGATIDPDCNDVWGNAGFEYQGMPDPTGSDGNISEDPRFCDLVGLELNVDATSPCAPAHSPPGCDLIGALGVNCSPPVPAENTTWGRLKASWR